MAGEAIFLGWGQVVRGREQLALQVFQEAVSYYGKLEQEGQIERFDAYLLDPHGGDLRLTPSGPARNSSGCWCGPHR